MQINSIVAKVYPCGISLTLYSVLNSCTVECINCSILFPALPLKGSADKKTLSINLLFIQELKKAEVFE